MSGKFLLMLMAAFAIAVPTSLNAQAKPPAPSMRILPGTAKAVSAHVHVIPLRAGSGEPNIGIVVGARAVLVIDSGLGKPSGQVIFDEVRRIAGDRRIYVIATHSHPEHIGGEQGFPPSAVILRPIGQQVEVDSPKGKALIEFFRGMSPDNALLLKDFAYRPADVILSGPVTTLDLGGVTVDIIDAAPAHSDGDTAFLVREDGVLFTGDVIQSNYAPVMGGAHSTLATWLAQVDKLEKLPAQIIVPDHTAVTDRRAFADMRAQLTFIRDRWVAIKAMHLSDTEAGDRLVADYKARFPACDNAELLRRYLSRL
jgi:glyoxylase-like metal-dependent hydrolase (beta-lactamase superfamily II)